MEKLLKQEDVIRVAEEAMEAALSGEVRIMLSVRWAKRCIHWWAALDFFANLLTDATHTHTSTCFIQVNRNRCVVKCLPQEEKRLRCSATLPVWLGGENKNMGHSLERQKSFFLSNETESERKIERRRLISFKLLVLYHSLKPNNSKTTQAKCMECVVWIGRRPKKCHKSQCRTFLICNLNSKLWPVL